MMQQPWDVSSLLRQMQMNMMMPSLVSPQQVRMVPNMMQEATLQPAQSSPVPAMSQPQAMVPPIQSQSVLPHAHGSLPDHGGSSNLVGQQMAPYAQDGGSEEKEGETVVLIPDLGRIVAIVDLPDIIDTVILVRVVPAELQSLMVS